MLKIKIRINNIRIKNITRFYDTNRVNDNEYNINIFDIKCINSNKLYNFNGKIFIGNTEESWTNCIERILDITNKMPINRTENIVGLVTDFSLTIQPEERFVSTVQLAFENECFIFQSLFYGIQHLTEEKQYNIRSSEKVFILPCESRLKKILLDPKLTFVALDMEFYSQALLRFLNTKLKHKIDMRAKSFGFGLEEAKFVNVVKAYVGAELYKPLQDLLYYDWDTVPLTRNQVRQAGLDTFCNRMLYLQLLAKGKKIKI